MSASSANGPIVAPIGRERTGKGSPEGILSPIADEGRRLAANHGTDDPASTQSAGEEARARGGSGPENAGFASLPIQNPHRPPSPIIRSVIGLRSATCISMY